MSVRKSNDKNEELFSFNKLLIYNSIYAIFNIFVNNSG